MVPESSLPRVKGAVVDVQAERLLPAPEPQAPEPEQVAEPPQADPEGVGGVSAADREPWRALVDPVATQGGGVQGHVAGVLAVPESALPQAAAAPEPPRKPERFKVA